MASEFIFNFSNKAAILGSSLALDALRHLEDGVVKVVFNFREQTDFYRCFKRNTQEIRGMLLGIAKAIVDV